MWNLVWWPWIKTSTNPELGLRLRGYKNACHMPCLDLNYCQHLLRLRYFSQAARGMKNLWWMKVMVPTKTLYIFNAGVVLITVWGIANIDLRGQTGWSQHSDSALNVCDIWHHITIPKLSPWIQGNIVIAHSMNAIKVTCISNALTKKRYLNSTPRSTI